MRVIAKETFEPVSYADPEKLERRYQGTQYTLTIDREYIVHAITVFEGHTYLCIIDDNSQIIWPSNLLFIISEHSIPEDWQINTYSVALPLVIGPWFIVENFNTYNSMIEGDFDPVIMFWRRAKYLYNIPIPSKKS